MNEEEGLDAMNAIQEEGSQSRRFGRGKEGVVLIIVMSFLAAMVVLGGIMISIFSVDLREVGYHKRGIEAFHQADGGARHVLSRINSDLMAGTLVLNQSVQRVSYPAPAGLAFDTVTNLTRLTDGRSYVFRVTGRSGLSRASVELVIVPLDVKAFGLLSKRDISFSAGGGVIDSYNSAAGPYGVANRGANAYVRSDGNITIGGICRGDAIPGPGCTAGGNITGSTVPASTNLVLDPVPADALSDARTQNDNASINPAFIKNGTELLVNAGGILNLGAGTYYFTKFTLSGGSELIVNGKVTIYVEGGSIVGSGGSILNVSQIPSNLAIYHSCAPNTQLTLSGGSDFYGMIYAPDSKVTFSGGSGFCGSLVGGSVTFSGNSSFHADTAFLGNNSGCSFVSWKLVD